MTAPRPAELLAIARGVAGEAAELVAHRRQGRVEVAATKSSAVDVVTEADREAERLIRDRLAVLRPGDAILGEEGGATAGDSRVRWVVDPIDGTVNYLYGLPQYAVSLAAEVDGEAVAGVVVNAATGATYAAALGAGATCDGVRLAVRGSVPLGQRLIATGFGYDAGLRAVQAATVGRLLPRIRDIRRLGSCALDLCLVAQGQLDGYVEEGVNPWDHAAGGLVLREAGGRTLVARGAGGSTLLVAAPAEGFDEFARALREDGFFAAAEAE